MSNKENYLENLNIEMLAERLAYYIGKISEIHPFRESNKRTQSLFLRMDFY